MKAPTGKLAYAYDTIETLQQRIAELEAQLASGHLVDKGALQMVVNALRRDAAEGKAARGEMADALEAQLSSKQKPLSEREAFEAWAVEQNYEVRALKSDGRYWSSHTHIVWEAWQARATHPAPAQQPLSEAYEKGWREAAKWANRDDLIADIGSPAYLKDMAAHGIKEKP